MANTTNDLLPRWAWFVLIPLVEFVAMFFAWNLAMFILAPFHLPSAGMDEGKPLEPVLCYYISYFIAPILAGLAWPIFAPFLRTTAAASLAGLYYLPCFFCSPFTFIALPRPVVNMMLFWSLVGCIIPILVHGILDIRAKRILRI